MAMTDNAILELLEEMIDQRSLAEILALISGVCSEKMEHIQASYATSRRTDPTAREWAKASNAIMAVVMKVNV